MILASQSIKFNQRGETKNRIMCRQDQNLPSLHSGEIGILLPWESLVPPYFVFRKSMEGSRAILLDSCNPEAGYA